MTTEPLRPPWSVVAAALVLIGACAGSVARRGGWPPERIEALPEDLQSSYRLFAARCSRCHTLSRPLTAGIDDAEHWRRYVARMRRMPGSGISGEDAVKLLVFLEYHAAWVRRQAEDGDWLKARFSAPASASERAKDDARQP